MTDPRLVSDVRRIAVLRANALGDLIFALPALDALRVAYPDAEIVLLARDWHRAFLEGRRGPVDRVIPLPDDVPIEEVTGEALDLISERWGPLPQGLERQAAAAR